MMLRNGRLDGGKFAPATTCKAVDYRGILGSYYIPPFRVSLQSAGISQLKCPAKI
jgi:hypothetical protein